MNDIYSRKILFVSHESKLYGASKSLFYIISGLNESFNCEVVTFGKGPFVEILESLKICPHIIKNFSSKTGSIYGKIHNQLVKRARLILNIYKLIKVIRRTKPDLLYVNTIAKISPVIAGKICRVPIIVHVREGEKYLFPENRNKKLGVKVMVKFTDIFICVSQATKRNLESIPGIKAPIYVVYNGVNASEFQRNADKNLEIRQELKIPIDSIIVGFIGRPTYLKGIDILIEAILYFERIPDIYFVIVGGTEKEIDLCKTKIQDYNNKDRIHFVLFQNNITTYYSAFDLFVMPSLSEQFSRVLLEAACMECPIIATNVGGTTEALVDGESALIIPSGSVSDLVSAITRLIYDKSYALFLAANAKKRIQTHFSIDQSNIKIKIILQDFFNR